MGSVTLQRLNNRVLAKYEAREKAGTLTPRQARALQGHRILTGSPSMAEFSELIGKFAEAGIGIEIEIHTPPAPEEKDAP